MEKIIKTNEAIDTYKALEVFVEKDLTLSAQLAWDIEDNMETLKKIVDKFEKHRVELMTPFNEQGAFVQEEDRIIVKKEFEEDFIEASKKLDEFLATDNTLEIKTVSRADLPEKLSVKDLKALKFMIAE